jgi:hypothetical protein
VKKRKANRIFVEKVVGKQSAAKSGRIILTCILRRFIIGISGSSKKWPVALFCVISAQPSDFLHTEHSCYGCTAY